MPLPTIPSGNVASALPSGYDVDNSCRFNSADSAELTKTFSGAGNQKTWTFSCWLKRSALSGSTAYSLIEAGYGSTPWFASTINNDAIAIAATAGSSASWSTAAVFRDVAAWYHIVLVVDTTQSTSSISNGSTDRIRVFVNNVQQTLSGGTVPSLNADLQWNGTAGQHMFGASYGQFQDCYVSEVAFIDGSALNPSSFAEYDDDSPTIWKPKDFSGDVTFGSNGYYLDFKDSSALGNDVSGNNNDWTVANLAAIDQTTDTPTNSFATFNPLAQTTDKGVLAEGNLSYDESTTTNAWTAIASTLAASNGKWYFEYKIGDGGDSAGNGSQVGVINYDDNDFQNDASSDLSASYGWYGPGNVFITGSDAGIMSSYTDGDIVCVAMDLDNNKIYWRKNAEAWINSGDPTSGATGTGAQSITNNTGSDFFSFAVSHRESGDGKANFGNPIETISSGHADANGYGNFEHAPPTGYYAMCTKNLAEFG